MGFFLNNHLSFYNILGFEKDACLACEPGHLLLACAGFLHLSRQLNYEQGEVQNALDSSAWLIQDDLIIQQYACI